MSPENKIHFKKRRYEDDFCFQLNNIPGIKLSLLLETTVKLDNIQRKKILFEAIREYPKKRGPEVLRYWREKIGTEESPVLCTGCPPRYLPIPKMYICRVKFVKLNQKYLLGRDFDSFTVLGR